MSPHNTDGRFQRLKPLLLGASLVVASVASTALAQSSMESPGARSHATLSLISASKAWEPGQTLLLAFNLDIEDDWHTYWRGVSDTGQPPEFNLTLPEGFVAGPYIWPAPKREITQAIDALDHIYEHRLTVVVPVQTPKAGTKEAEATSAHFAASGVWLVCKNACVPEQGEALLDLPRGEATPHDTHAAWIDETAAQKEISLGDLKTKSLETLVLDPTEGTYTLIVPGATEMIFFPDRGCYAVPALIREGRVQGPKLRLTLAPQDDPSADRVKGLLKVWGLEEKPVYVRIDKIEKPRATNHEPDRVR